MPSDERVNILLVDDQQAKLLSYEVILRELGENLIKATSGREALEHLLKTDVAVILMDVNMPDLDGFQLAAMIREHPRYERTAIIFISAIHLSDVDRLKGYEMGAVDYVPVPVVAEVLRAKVRVFAELYRKTRQLRLLNDELERRVAERTEQLETSMRRQSILAREVDHRAKNVLAVVQSIVRLTRADTVPDFIQSVEGRIAALSRAHALLSHSRWQGASLGKLVEEELAPYRTAGGERILVTGSEVMLIPVMAQTLALALHELATNAAKYGALSKDLGQVSVDWRAEPGSLVLDWQEKRGPKPPAPVKKGFGTKLIVASIESQLGGTVDFDWRPQGLQCTLTIPLRDPPKQVDTLLDSAPREERTAAAPPARLSGQRILLVEDEAVVALMMVEMLTELGLTVLGPFASLKEAASAARRGNFDAAILDINLGGEFVYPVADVLVANKVPFIFVTGYGPERIDGRFASIPVLQKPLKRPLLEDAFASAIPAS